MEKKWSWKKGKWEKDLRAYPILQAISQPLATYYRKSSLCKKKKKYKIAYFKIAYLSLLSNLPISFSGKMRILYR